MIFLLKSVIWILNLKNVKKIHTLAKSEAESIRYRFQLKNRKWDVFLETYNDWLDTDVHICTHDDKQEPCTSSGSRGRPKKTFAQSSLRTKQRQIKSLLKDVDSDLIQSAAAASLRASGKRTASSIIEEVSQASPRRSKEYRKVRRIFQEKSAKQVPYTSDEALSMFISAKFSVFQYKNLRTGATERGYDLYPSYNKLVKAKKRCLPPEEDIIVTETSAEVKLQSLLDHTAKRLCLLQQEVLERFQGETFTIHYKWGCDGSSGHSTYKQKFSSASDTDEFMFIISVVPLRMNVNNEDNTLVWHNLRASSTRFCRPIKFIYKKETEEVIKSECDLVRQQIANLTHTKCKVSKMSVEIGHNLQLTMVDGKICNVLTDTRSTQKCYICGVTSKNMNTVGSPPQPNTDAYSFGISTLHAWIRSFECLLHISYRLPIKKWQMRSNEDKKIYADRKKDIQMKFKSEMGLNVDIPKPGAGNTNDGNTARKFFYNAENSAAVTGIDINLIKRFCVILRTLSSGFEIDAEKFSNFVEITRELYLSLYNWYPMSVTVHKILTHAPEIVSSCFLPIGMMSEEAQEARNKDVRNIRLWHSRKTYREDNNRDLFNYLLVASDIIISSKHKPKTSGQGVINKDVLNLLKSS